METKNKYSFEDAGNRLPFEVPENYFNEFAARMEELTGNQKVPVKRMARPWLYMAAMFVGLFLIGNILLQVFKTNRINHTEAYEAYLLSQLDESVYYDYYFTEVAYWDDDPQNGTNE
jgi:hypothetical protein